METLGDRLYQRPLEILSGIPSTASVREALPAVLSALDSGEDLHPMVSASLRLLSRRMLADYEASLRANEPGHSRGELRELRRTLRGTTWLGRRINQLWPF